MRIPSEIRATLEEALDDSVLYTDALEDAVESYKNEWYDKCNAALAWLLKQEDSAVDESRNK